jgi:hypothetical protein
MREPRRNTHYRVDPPLDLDPTGPLQDAFNPSERKKFILKRTGIIQHPKTGRRMREFLLVDNFGNNWITYLATCADLEVHQWPTDRNAYVKPSMIAAHGGRLSADLFDSFRDTAFKVFDRQDKAVRAMRTLATNAAGRIIADVTKLELPPPPKLTLARKAGGNLMEN